MHSAFIRDRAGVYVLVASLLLFIACLIKGFSLDAHSMAVNLLAGIACVALGVPVAIWVVDWYMRRAARTHWSRVETLTHRTIAMHICDAMVQLLIDTTVLNNLSPMASIQEGRDQPDAKTIEGLSALASMLRAVSNPGNNDLSDAAIVFYENGKWDLDQLCDSLLSRLIEYSDEHDLIDSLVELDGVRRTLHTSIIAHKQVVTGGVFVHLAELVDATTNVYRSLLNHWHLNDSN